MPEPELAVLPKPYELLELGDGGSVEFPVLKWEHGTMTIQPRDGRQAKEIEVLRVHVPPEVKPIFPDYYDITATTLIAQVLPVLQAPGWEARRFKVQKFGVAPRARFQVTVSTPGAS